MLRMGPPHLLRKSEAMTDLNDLTKRLTDQYQIIDRQRLQMAAQRQALEDLTAWVISHATVQKLNIPSQATRAQGILREFP